MLKHIVFWKIKEFAENAGKQENMNKIKTMLEALPALIPEIKKLEVGFGCVPNPDAYDVALYSEFDDVAALQTYQKNPDHLKVGEFIGKVKESRAVVDYTI